MVRPSRTSKPKKSHGPKARASPKRVLGLAKFQPQDVGGVDYPARKKRKDRKLPPIDIEVAPKEAKTKTPAKAKTPLVSPIRKTPIRSSKRAQKAEMSHANVPRRAATPPSGRHAIDEDALARKMNDEPKHGGMATRSRGGMPICSIL